MNAVENMMKHLTFEQMAKICADAGLSCHNHEYDSSLRDRIQGALRRDEIPAHLILAAWDGECRDVVPAKQGHFAAEKVQRQIRVNGILI